MLLKSATGSGAYRSPTTTTTSAPNSAPTTLSSSGNSNTNSNNKTMQDMAPFTGLRGICAMAIFLGHQSELFLNYNVGWEYFQAVTLFFLLSGIPLVRLYSSKMMMTMMMVNNENVNISNNDWWCINPTIDQSFWKKRCARLFPIYYLTLVLNLSMVLVAAVSNQLNKDTDNDDYIINIRASLISFLGCALFLQSWWVNFITLGGPLWQVAVFMYGYVCFPAFSRWIRTTKWTTTNDMSLVIGMLLLWGFSAGILLIIWFGVSDLDERYEWLVLWHLFGLTRLPQFLAGVLLGEWVERKRCHRHRADHNNNNNSNSSARMMSSCCGWATLTDLISIVLLGTAIQSPIVQYYWGTERRSYVSFVLEGLFLPLHALWLAGIVLAYHPPDDCNSSDETRNGTRCCWTRRVLLFQPFVALGEVSLVLYCIHLVVLFYYTKTVVAIFGRDAFGEEDEEISSFTYTIQLPWWPHAPLQWMLVVWVAFGVSKWFEAPLRKTLVAKLVDRQQLRMDDTSIPPVDGNNETPPSTKRLLLAGSDDTMQHNNYGTN